MKWRAFTYQGQPYPLDHLDSFTDQLTVAAQGANPERTYRLNVDFSLHCFTRGATQSEQIPPDLAYADSRETRIFDFDRYQQSLGLPAIVRQLAERRCYHDHHGNFYVVELERPAESLNQDLSFFYER